MEIFEEEESFFLLVLKLLQLRFASVPVRGRPFLPIAPIVFFFQETKERIILEPVGMRVDESLERSRAVGVLFPLLIEKISERLFQEGALSRRIAS